VNQPNVLQNEVTSEFWESPLRLAGFLFSDPNLTNKQKLDKAVKVSVSFCKQVSQIPELSSLIDKNSY
jgi:hypothetical protein